MQTGNRYAALVLLGAALIACESVTTPPTQYTTVTVGIPEGGTVGTPITTFTTPATGGCPAVRPKTVLVDATHDGGVWWFPQWEKTPGGFHPDSAHQGRALAMYLRDHGYTVRELARGVSLPTDSMRTYATVIRAGYYYDVARPGYSKADLDAYKAYLACPRTLVLLSEFLRDGRRDVLADSLGIPLTGFIAPTTITDLTAHALTEGVASVPFGAGSYLQSGADASIQVLGRLSSGEAVMGVLPKGEAKVFFIGDTNGIQWLPQPFVDNLVAWGFK